MKKAFLVIMMFSLITVSAFGENLTGFWGVPWGSSLTKTEEIMAAKGYSPDSSASNGMTFKNASFAGRDCTVTFFLKNGGFYMGAATILPAMNKSYEEYIALKDDLINKYGEPAGDVENYKSPYEKGDGHTETAISLNYATIGANWIFEDKNEIVLMLVKNEKEYQIELNLVYMEKNIMDIAIEEKQKSVLDDL